MDGALQVIAIIFVAGWIFMGFRKILRRRR